MKNISNVNLFGKIEATKMVDGNFPMTKLRNVEQAEGSDFKSVFEGLVQNLNETANAPDKLINDAMVGNADIHDVVTAIQKADIEVNLATTVVGKVIQAYEKISQISI